MKAFLTAIAATGLISACVAAEMTSTTVAGKYPYLCAGALQDAVVAELVDGVIATSDGIRITQKDIENEVAKSPRSLQEQIKRYPVYALEQLVTRKLIASEAAAWAKQNGKDGGEQALVDLYLAAQIPEFSVTDKEIEQFYKEHTNMFGGMAFEDVKAVVASFVREQKTTEGRDKFTGSEGKRHKIEVSSSWIKAQHERWAENPVEQARISGKPTVAVFSVIGCCDRMFAVAEALRTLYGGKLNVTFVHVGDEEVLADLYGIDTIPVEMFFDENGKEIGRNQGYLSADQIRAKFREHGIKL